MIGAGVTFYTNKKNKICQLSEDIIFSKKHAIITHTGIIWKFGDYKVFSLSTSQPRVDIDKESIENIKINNSFIMANPYVIAKEEDFNRYFKMCAFFPNLPTSLRNKSRNEIIEDFNIMVKKVQIASENMKELVRLEDMNGKLSCSKIKINREVIYHRSSLGLLSSFHSRLFYETIVKSNKNCNFNSLERQIIENIEGTRWCNKFLEEIK